jgi:hypothetical protein
MAVKRRGRPDCKTCGNCVFDEIWGDRKCKMLKRVLKKTDDAKHCIYYTEGVVESSAASKGEDD